MRRLFILLLTVLSLASSPARAGELEKSVERLTVEITRQEFADIQGPLIVQQVPTVTYFPTADALADKLSELFQDSLEARGITVIDMPSQFVITLHLCMSVDGPLVIAEVNEHSGPTVFITQLLPLNDQVRALFEEPLAVLPLSLRPAYVRALPGTVLDAAEAHDGNSYILFSDNLSVWDHQTDSLNFLVDLQQLGHSDTRSRDPVGKIAIACDGSVSLFTSDLDGTYTYNPALESTEKYIEYPVLGNWSNSTCAMLKGRLIPGQNIFEPDFSYSTGPDAEPEEFSAPGQVYDAKCYTDDTESRYLMTGPDQAWLSKSPDMQPYVTVKSGSAAGIADFYHDNNPILITTSTEPVGRPDIVTAWDLRPPLPVMLWSSHTLPHSVRVISSVEPGSTTQILLFAPEPVAGITHVYSLSAPEKHIPDEPIVAVVEPVSTTEPEPGSETPIEKPKPRGKRPWRDFLEKLRNAFEIKP